MANVVLIAKMVYVWLDQLAKKYGRPDRPASTRSPMRNWTGWPLRAFTALWLIGVWERSPASQRIKQLCGNPEAVASAYSLYDYVIAARPGRGGGARQSEGTGLAGAGSAWPATWCRTTPASTPTGSSEHPDWFIQLDYPPYPAYRFTGPDLSYSPEISVSISRTATGSGRRRGGIQALRPRNRQDPLHLPRQRRHHHPLERHCPAQLPSPRRTGGGHSDHPPRGPAVFHHPFRRRHDPGEEALPAPVVPPAGARQRRPLARRARHDPGGVRRAHFRRSSGARWWTGWRPRRPTHSFWPRRSGSWRGTSSARWECTGSTTAPS